MADGPKEPSPAEQLIELLVYAPVGLLYEYQEVLPKLIKRGKSQVQLARVVGQMAANRRQSDPAGAAEDLMGLASGLINKVVTEVGSQIGLAPPSKPPVDSTTPKASGSEEGQAADGHPAPEESVDATKPLPIARYDELTAREIIPLLDELSGAQCERIRVHETANRNRKTVLAKLDRLGR